jgi:hypothetical protein
MRKLAWILGLALVVGTCGAAQAALIPLNNPSFEDPDLPNNAADPTDWDVTASGVWTVQVEDGGPATDGDQVLELRNEVDGWEGIVSQVVPISQLVGTSSAVMTFDARRGNPLRASTDILQEGGTFSAYFKVNGVKDTAGDYETTTGAGHDLPDNFQWVTRQVTLDTSALTLADQVEVVFHDVSGPRLTEMQYICVDSVSLETFAEQPGGDAVPEPATLALVGLGAIGLLIRRK